MKNKIYPIVIAIAFAALFFVVGVASSKDYNVNWDEPQHYTKGQAILRFFLTGQKDYKSLNSISNPRISIYQQDPLTAKSAFYFYSKVFEHPPLNDILASMSNYIFYQKLGILGDIDSYHLFIIFTSSILVFLVSFFCFREYGLFAGLIAFLSLVLYPIFVGESHNNIKDPVETTFYALTIYWFYKGITGNKIWQILVGSLFAGVALGTKFNILFVFIPLVIWAIFYKWSKIKNLRWPFSRSMTIVLVISMFIPWLILIITWPNLWSNTFQGIYKVFNYYKQIGGTVWQPYSYLTFFGFNTYAVKWIFYTTPIPILILSFFGVVYSIKNGINEKRKTSILVLAWFLIPVIRVSLPNVGIYGGVRQIMEYIPAMAILSGIGANEIAKLLNLTIKPLTIIRLCIILIFIPTAIKLISIHPNETVYFNQLAGGLRGAYKKDIQAAGNDLGNSYRQGANWLNRYAEKNARLSLIVNGRSALPKMFLRDDIIFENDFWDQNRRPGGYVMNTTEIGWNVQFPDELQERLNKLETLKPVFEVKVDGAPILKLWKIPRDF